MPPYQLSRKVLRILDRLGCLSLRSAFASIWRMRSRVTENCWPTSSSVWSALMPMPKRMRTMRSSRGVKGRSAATTDQKRFEIRPLIVGHQSANQGRSPAKSSLESIHDPLRQQICPHDLARVFPGLDRRSGHFHRSPA